MSGQHFLIVHEEPDDGMEVEHPADCPTATAYDGRVTIYTCVVGQIVEQWWQEYSEYVAVGRYPIEYWSETRRIQYGVVEFDCGLRLCAEGGGS